MVRGHLQELRAHPLLRSPPLLHPKRTWGDVRVTHLRSKTGKPEDTAQEETRPPLGSPGGPWGRPCPAHHPQLAPGPRVPAALLAECSCVSTADGFHLPDRPGQPPMFSSHLAAAKPPRQTGRPPRSHARYPPRPTHPQLGGQSRSCFRGCTTATCLPLSAQCSGPLPGRAPGPALSLCSPGSRPGLRQELLCQAWSRRGCGASQGPDTRNPDPASDP